MAISENDFNVPSLQWHRWIMILFISLVTSSSAVIQTTKKQHHLTDDLSSDETTLWNHVHRISWIPRTIRTCWVDASVVEYCGRLHNSEKIMAIMLMRCRISIGVTTRLSSCVPNIPHPIHISNRHKVLSVQRSATLVRWTSHPATQQEEQKEQYDRATDVPQLWYTLSGCR